VESSTTHSTHQPTDEEHAAPFASWFTNQLCCIVPLTQSQSTFILSQIAPAPMRPIFPPLLPAPCSLPPPQRGRDLDSTVDKASKQVSPITFSCLDTPRARAWVREIAFSGADNAECPPPARQRRSVAGFTQPRSAVCPHRRQIWWAYMALPWPGMPS
jgi:hypothetical protein